MSPTRLHRLLPILGVIALSSGTLGCSFSITPEAVEPPPTKISPVAIGSIETADPDRQRVARRFRRALMAGLEDSEAFSRVLSTVPAQLPEDAVLVTGRFLEVDDGSEALRFLVGAGAGAPSLRARFEISDPTGRVLVSFEEDARLSTERATPRTGTPPELTISPTISRSRPPKPSPAGGAAKSWISRFGEVPSPLTSARDEFVCTRRVCLNEKCVSEMMQSQTAPPRADLFG